MPSNDSNQQNLPYGVKIVVDSPVAMSGMVAKAVHCFLEIKIFCRDNLLVELLQQLHRIAADDMNTLKLPLR